MPIELTPTKTKKAPHATEAPPPPGPVAPQPEPEPVTASGSTRSAEAGADAPHLDGLTVAEPAGTAEPGETPFGVMVETNGFIPMPVFIGTLGATFTMTGGFLGLKTLMEAPKQDTYPAAAEALYHTIVDTPSMHFLIQPGGAWMQRAIAMGAFALPLGYSVRAELTEKRKNRPVASAGKAPPPVVDHPRQTEPPPETGDPLAPGVVPGQSTQVGVLDTLSNVPG